MEELTFVCLACRLLQPAGAECAECGSSIGEIETASELLKYRDANDITQRKSTGKATLAGFGVASVASAAGIVLLGPIALAALPVIAYASIMGTGVVAATRARKHRRIVAIAVSDPAIGDGAVERTGIARPLTGPITSKIDDGPILVEQVVIGSGSSILLRRVRATPFLLGADEDAVAVTGEVRLATPPTTTKRAATDPLFAQLGIPPGILPKKVIVDIRTLRPGDAVVARGVVEDATIQELAFYREGGQAHALHGRRGSLVVIRAS